MKTTMNKLLLLTTMSAIVMGGCTSTAMAVSDVRSIDIVETQPTNSTWNSKKPLDLNQSKKENCLDCYATVSGIAEKKVAVSQDSESVYAYDASNTTVNTYDGKETDESNDTENNSYPYDSAEDTYVAHNTYLNQSIASSQPTIESFPNKTAIQVGAFRKYAGAKVYAKKYSLLSNRYDVKIKKNVKDNRPLYRVHIEGFSNRSEAKEFISKYGISEAFLVRN